MLSFETVPVLNTFPEEMKEKMLGFIAGTGEYFADKTVRKEATGYPVT